MQTQGQVMVGHPAMNPQMAQQMQQFQMGAKGAYAGAMYPPSPYPHPGVQACLAGKGGDQGDQFGSCGKGGFGGGGGMMKGGKSKDFKGGGFKGGFGGKGRGFGKGMKGGFGGGDGGCCGGYGDGYGGNGGGGCGSCGSYGGDGGACGGYGGGGYGGGFSGSSGYMGTWTPDAEAETTRQIEIAQRRAKFRDKSAITQAQRSAQMRFEKDLLDRVQGNWVDEADRSVNYVVEGSLCTVSGGDNARVFRNRLSVYNGELCWDARRWWHKLDIKSLPPGDEAAERVEWLAGQGSPETQNIVWVRGEPPAPLPVMVGEAQDDIDAGEDVFAVPPDTT